jgi:hypothetical protein
MVVYSGKDGRDEVERKKRKQLLNKFKVDTQYRNLKVEALDRTP